MLYIQALQGEKIDLASIERYIGAGVNTQDASKTFLNASVTARMYGRLSRKYGRNTNLGKVSSMLESTLFGDELIEGQIKSIATQALSESSPGIGAAQTQGGQVIRLDRKLKVVPYIVLRGEFRRL